MHEQGTVKPVFLQNYSDADPNTMHEKLYTKHLTGTYNMYTYLLLCDLAKSNKKNTRFDA